MKLEESNESRASGSRRTRSQLGPDWTLKDALILVNEIVAVEGDCQKALSSFQKWNIIAGNCTVLDVPRTSNQCRRKWDSLLDEYNKIKKWESQSRNDSFWSLASERRKKFGLPEIFDDELFKAIDDHLRTRETQSDTEPDSDPEAEADVLEVDEEIGPKKQKRRLRPPRSCREGKLPKCNSHREEKPLQNYVNEKPLNSCMEEQPRKRRVEEKPQRSHNEEESSSREESFSEEDDVSVEEKEQMMVAKLRENAEFIHAIVNGKPAENIMDYRAAGLKNVQDFQTDSVRRKGDALIACLGDIVNTLRHLHENVKDCE